MTIKQEIVRAYAQGVPLAYVLTADEPAAQRMILEALSVDDPPAVYLHSPLMGLEPLTDAAAADIAALTQGGASVQLSDAAQLLRNLAAVPVGDRPRVIIWSGADRAWSDPGLAGALGLLRDRLGARGISIIGTGADVITSRLADDVHTIRDALPADEERAAILTRLFGGNDLAVSTRDLTRAVNGTRGLTRFATEQVASLACYTGELEIDTLQARWREQLGSLPGVTVETPLPESYFGGSVGWIEHVRRYAPASPSLVVCLDEFEKIVPSVDARDSGVSRAILQLLLTEMSRVKPISAIAVGVMGTGKSLSALVAGSIYGCPVITLDLTAFKQSEVGASERNARRTFQALRAFGGKQIWIATANGLTSVDGALRSRFRGGTWYFPLPSQAELLAIWRANSERYGVPIPGGPPAHGPGWTGRDVESTFLECLDSGRALASEAAARVPTGRTLRADIEAMGNEAVRGAYTCAQTGRVYTGETTAPPVETQRLMRKPAPITPEENEVF